LLTADVSWRWRHESPPSEDADSTIGCALPLGARNAVLHTYTLPKKRLELFNQFQKLVVEDLPTLDIVTPSVITVYDKRVKNLKLGAEDLWSNGADIYLEA
jgi:hypothetical protein